jgi:hypothetical protein
VSVYGPIILPAHDSFVEANRGSLRLVFYFVIYFKTLKQISAGYWFTLRAIHRVYRDDYQSELIRRRLLQKCGTKLIS